MEHHEMTTRKPLLNRSGSTVQRDTSHKDANVISSISVASTQEHTSSPISFSHICRILKWGWTAETISCLVAVAALVGLIVILLLHQDKPLPQWPQAVTINSIVSIFSLLIRAGVCFILAEGISQLKWQWFRKPHRLDDMQHFDNASRGAWGSTVLLFRFRWGRPYWIAALGCLITIMASLTGFFTQQLVTFQDCLQKDPTARAGVSRTNNYTASGESIGNALFDTYPPMVAAINIGIIQPVKDLTSVLSHNCVTGNCTFPSDNNASFSTVGVGHICKNATSEVRIVYGNSTTQGMVLSLNMSTTSSTNKSLSFATTGSPVTLVTGAMEGDTDGYGSITTVKMMFRKSLDARNYTAISCSIFPTVNTYSVKITNSIMVEKLMDSTPIRKNVIPLVKPNSDFLIRYKLATSHVLRNGTRQLCERQEASGPSLFGVAEGNVDAAPNYSLTSAVNDTKIWYYPQDCVWVFWSGPAQGIAAYMSEIFTDQQLIWARRLGGNKGSVYLRQIFQNGEMSLATVDDMFKNITTAMTSVIRTNGQGGTSEDARGEMWFTTTCAKINWHWISFPAALIGLTASFLILIAIESRGVESDRLWKSSVLAMLFCEVDQTVISDNKSMGKKDLSGVARRTSASLNSDGRALVVEAPTNMNFR